MTPTEALARALVEAMGRDEWYGLMPGDAAFNADRIRRRLKAKGYEVRPIAERERYEALRRYRFATEGIEQAAEAADREAAGARAPDSVPSAAVAPLDVEAVAAGFNAVFDQRAWDDPAPVFAAAYADAIRKRGGA